MHKAPTLYLGPLSRAYLPFIAIRGPIMTIRLKPARHSCIGAVLPVLSVLMSIRLIHARHDFVGAVLPVLTGIISLPLFHAYPSSCRSVIHRTLTSYDRNPPHPRSVSRYQLSPQRQPSL